VTNSEEHDLHQQPRMVDAIQHRYWLYRWMDESGIDTLKQFHRAVRSPGAIGRLEEYSASTVTQPTTSISSRSVIPARTIDLSGTLSCSDFECMARQVDTLFGRTWHYFDTIVLDGSLIEDLHVGSEIFLRTLEQRVKLLLYMRKIGAEQHVAFSRKVSGYCSQHFRDYAIQKDLGLEVLFDRNFEEEVVRKLTNESAVSIERYRSFWMYEVRYGELKGLWQSYSHSDLSNMPSKEDVIRDTFGRYCAALISDLSAVRNLGLPLLQPAETPFLSYSPPDSDTQDQMMALDLRLPVLANVSAKDILQFRNEHKAEFERFRTALQEAVKEQIARNGSASPDVIARQVVEEYIVPELASIESKLNVSRRTLARKIGANVAVASAAVSVGAIASVPLVIASGIAAIVPAFGPINKYFDDKSNVELSDLYFLWRARIRHEGRKH
jgi:hypothetical protein